MDTSVNEGGEQVSQGLNEDASQLTLTGAQKRAAWVLVGLMATVAYAGLWYFFFYDYWGERALRSLLEAIGIPLLIVLFWWPVVWASAKWLVRDLMRWVTSTRGGQRGRPPAPPRGARRVCRVRSRAGGRHLRVHVDFWSGCRRLARRGNNTRERHLPEYA